MRFLPLLLTLLTLWPALLWAETSESRYDQWQLCPSIFPAGHEYTPPEAFSEADKDATRISARQIENAAGNVSIFTGDVLIERDQLRLQADQVSYERDRQLLNINGNIHIDAGSMSISADQGWLNIENNSGAFSNSRYFLPQAHFRGNTPSLSFENNKQTLLIDSSYTSCPENREDWRLDTGYLELNHETQTGTAKHAVLWFKSVPILYTPYISFPLGEERRSGFLMPSFGTSGSSGFEMSIPWYWNIAPNHDALFTPHYMRKRGTQLITNYRYLTHSSKGELDVEYLDNDELLDLERYLIKFQNHSDIGSDLDLDVLINDVSDIDYLNDMGSNINISNITHLERSAKFSYYAGPWRMNILGQSYETIDDTIAVDSRPYRRLPQLTLAGTDDVFNDKMTWSLSSQWVDFMHDSETKNTGQRFDVYPKISLPFGGHAWFMTPSIGWRLTQYDVIDGTQTALDITDRELSIASLDSGLFFERDVADGKYIQTLEPRLYYLNIPYEDQSAIPLFDTGEADFSFSQLFRENRFNGIDRIGDANQLTVAISSRLLNKQHGDELLSLNLGQIFYYDDRQVQLDNIPVTDNSSDIISELRSAMGNWSTRLTAQWDPERDKTDKRSMQLKYQPESHKIINLGYRFRRDLADETNNLEQTDFSFIWPVTSVYSVLGRWNYSVTEKRDIETLFGIEYDSCCWAMRIVAQRFLRDDDSHDSSLMFQLIFKGLGSVTDKRATNVIKNAILGYQPEY